MDLQNFEESIKFKFKDKELLKNALTHTSYAYENKINSNEKLEFLGDAVLEFVVSSFLFKNYTKLSEGEMTKVRASVVCEKSLHEIAIKHNFGDFLFLGKSEVINGGKTRAAILADAVEAVIGGIYLDTGILEAEKFIIENLKDKVKEASILCGQKDYKTVFQEKKQVNGDVSIEYTVIKEEGPDHNKRFTVLLKLNGKEMAIGERKNKKRSRNASSKDSIRKIM